MGNMNALTYKEVFPLIRESKVWWGPSISSGDREFRVPDSYELNAAGTRIDPRTGAKYIRVKGIRWYTNLDFPKRHEKLELWKEYNLEDYPKYDNYDAINVNKVAEIPKDYDGVMGVPITFLDKYNPEQFEILKCSAYSNKENHGTSPLYVNGKKKFARLLIKPEFEKKK